MDTKTTLKQVGRTCQYIREYFGYTRRELAEKLNYSKQTIYDFERGRNNSAILLLFYFKFFSVDADIFYLPVITSKEDVEPYRKEINK